MASKKVSDVQFLNAIVDYHIEHGYYPTIREIGEIVGMTSSASVQTRFDQLIEKGFIYGNSKSPRAYNIKASWAQIPFADEYLCKACGNKNTEKTDFCPMCGSKMR